MRPECPLLAQSGHAQCADECPLLGAKRTVTNRFLPISIYGRQPGIAYCRPCRCLPGGNRATENGTAPSTSYHRGEIRQRSAAVTFAMVTLATRGIVDDGFDLIGRWNIYANFDSPLCRFSAC